MSLDPDVQLAIDHAHDLIAWEEWSHADLSLALMHAGSNAAWPKARVTVRRALGVPANHVPMDDRAQEMTRNDVLAALCRARES